METHYDIPTLHDKRDKRVLSYKYHVDTASRIPETAAAAKSGASPVHVRFLIKPWTGENPADNG